MSTLNDCFTGACGTCDYCAGSPSTVDMTDAAAQRWQSIQANTRVPVVLHEVMPDGGFTFGVDFTASGWRTFAVNPDGGRAYPLEF